MWSPANGLGWQKDSACAQPENKESVDWFFSKQSEEIYKAKNLCFTCPVRQMCLQWALEHKQIWGVWGGKDEIEIRRTLSVSYDGEETRRYRFPNCPYCSAWPSKLEVSVEKLPGGGRWTTAKVVTCTECGFAWKSRTSANAVESYKSSKNDRETAKRLRRLSELASESQSPPKESPDQDRKKK